MIFLINELIGKGSEDEESDGRMLLRRIVGGVY